MNKVLIKPESSDQYGHLASVYKREKEKVYMYM